MNNTLFWVRYIITGIIAFRSIDFAGPLGGLIVFVVANVLWSLAEESLINQRNLRETAKWREKNRG